MKNNTLKASVLLGALVFSGAAWGQSCSATITNMNFGAVDVLSSASTTTATISINCSGLSYYTVNICPNIGEGTSAGTASYRTMTNGASKLQYQLYSDNANSVVWGSYIWPFSHKPPILQVNLGFFGSGSTSATLYGRVFSGQGASAPTGNYSVSFAGHTVFAYAYGTASSQSCTSASRYIAPSFTVTANIPANCLLSTDPVDFGAAGVLSSNVDATGQIRLSCTQGTAYSIALDNGQSGTSPTNRRMTLGGQGITYGLYRDNNRSQPWGNTTGSNTFTGTGSGSNVNIPVYGRVPPQNTPAPGDYSDTVVVTVTY